MSEPRIDKSFEGLLKDQRRELVELRRRLGGRLPARLSRGMEVGDWNEALRPGFYWSTSALNSPPTAGTWNLGYVLTHGNAGQRVTQVVRGDGVSWNQQEWVRYSNNGGATWGAWTPEGGQTAWIALPYETGFSNATVGQLSYLVKDRVIYYKGGAYQVGGFPAGTYITVVPAGSIPAEFRPPHHYRTGAMGQTGRSGGAEILSTGAITFSHSNASDPNWMALLASYPIGV